MPSDSPAHDFLLPRLTALVAEAESKGFSRDTAVAVLIDLITSPQFDTAVPDPRDDSASHEIWKRGPHDVVLVNGASPTGPRDLDARDVADFVKPIPWFGS